MKILETVKGIVGVIGANHAGYFTRFEHDLLEGKEQGIMLAFVGVNESIMIQQY